MSRKRELKTLYIFLFNDMFILSKRKSSKSEEYHVETEHSLIDTQLFPALSEEELKKLKMKDPELFFKVRTPERDYFFKAENSGEKQKWINEFQKALKPK